MKRILVIIALITLMFSMNAVAMDSMKGMKGMDHGSKNDGDAFSYTAMVDSIHAKFQIMDLASMNMKDPNGNTHHVMATFMKDNKKVTKLVGKVKLISPSGKEQISTFKDYGSGVFAANFNIDEPGKWGVISLFKESGNKHIVKFWYNNMKM